MPIAEAEALKAYWLLSEANHDLLQEAVSKAAEQIPDFAPILKALSPQMREAQDNQSRELQRQALVEGNFGPYEQNLKQQGVGYARLGVKFSSWLPLFTVSRVALRPFLTKDPKAAEGMDAFLDRSLGILGDAYLIAKEDIITQQQEAIRELSTPVLQLRDGMLILPIVGMVDTERARKLTTSLLEAIRARRAADGRDGDPHRHLFRDRPGPGRHRRDAARRADDRRPAGRHRGGRRAAGLRGSAPRR